MYQQVPGNNGRIITLNIVTPNLVVQFLYQQGTQCINCKGIGDLYIIINPKTFNPIICK